MSFISLEFIAFACLVIPTYFLVPARLRVGYILITSYLFYGSQDVFCIALLFALTLVDYGIGLRIAAEPVPRRRRGLLWLSLAVNLGLLVFLKHFAQLAAAAGSPAEVLLPIGLSFYTFTKIAYVVDVYKGKIEPERSLPLFAAGIAFFPNLVSGPIERAEHLLPQLARAARFDEAGVVAGLRLILWGVFKKVVIADRLAVYVNAVYDRPQTYAGLPLLTATVFLAFEIYADFSGYTDIARGVARLWGVELFENFRQPYLAQSIQDFWRRWHISLTNWIREFLFFPLARALLIQTRRRYALAVEVTTYLVVMTLVGWWHGASWTFLLWGLLHGVYMGGESLANHWRIRILPRSPITPVVKTLFVFALVCVGWVFFRAETLQDGIYILTHLAGGAGAASEVTLPLVQQADAGVVALMNVFHIVPAARPAIELGLSFLLVGVLAASDVAASRAGTPDVIGRLPTRWRWACYYALTALILGLGAWGAQPFVYFAF